MTRLDIVVRTWLWTTAGALGAITAILFLGYVLAAIVFAPSLDFGEGVVLHQTTLIPGSTMYGDIFRYPFIVFDYPPFYFLVVHCVASLGPDLLQAGRIVSAASTLLSCVMLAVLVRKACGGSPSAWAGGCVAAVLPLTTLPVIAWVPLMRVDMLGLALTLGGLLLVLEAARHRWMMVPATLGFVAAMFTRQTFLAAPASVLGVAMLRFPRAALLAILGGALCAGGLAWALDAATAGGFLRHVVVNLGHNGFSLHSALRQIAWWTARYASLWSLALAGVCWAARASWPGWRGAARLIRIDARAFVLAAMFVYLVLASVMTVTIGKSGSWVNYLIEWIFVGAFWAGYACGMALEPRRGVQRRWARYAVVLLLVAQMANGPFSIVAWRDSHLTQARMAQNAALVARLRAIPGPVMADDMVALWRAGKDMGVESFNVAEMARMGVMPEDRLIALVRAHWFAAVVTQGGPGGNAFESRYLPATQAALLAAYPVTERFGDFVLRRPDERR